jgi:hypothetical protein
VIFDRGVWEVGFKRKKNVSYVLSVIHSSFTFFHIFTSSFVDLITYPFQTYTSEMGTFKEGDTYLYLRDEVHDDGTKYFILEKDRRFRVPSSYEIEVVSSPVSDEVLTWELRYKIASDIARFVRCEMCVRCVV